MEQPTVEKSEEPGETKTQELKSAGELIEEMRAQTRLTIGTDPKFKINAGPQLLSETHFLSWQYMQDTVQEARPFKEGGKEFNPFYESFGTHTPKKQDGSQCCIHDNNPLRNFGLGTALYFK